MLMPTQESGQKAVQSSMYDRASQATTEVSSAYAVAVYHFKSLKQLFGGPHHKADTL